MLSSAQRNVSKVVEFSFSHDAVIAVSVLKFQIQMVSISDIIKAVLLLGALLGRNSLGNSALISHSFVVPGFGRVWRERVDCYC